MKRSTLRGIALVVLALLGAPVAMHVVLHDLHDHHQAPRTTAFATDDCHGTHEHPVVGSPAPATVARERSAITVAVIPLTTTVTLVRHASSPRSSISAGALRLDDDVGLHALLSTFLI